MIVIPDESERSDLDLFLAGIRSVYHLFVNDIVPDANTVKADFVQPTWRDYAPKVVTSWTPALTVAGRAVSTADQQLWIRGSIGPPGQVYGYYVTDGITGPLLWCERRPAGPIRMLMPTDAVLLLPRISLAECGEGKLPIMGGGDQVEDGAGTVAPPSMLAGGDEVGDGAGTVPTILVGLGGDEVGDGEGTVVDVLIHAGGDEVGDGLGSGTTASRRGGGDEVEDGEGTVIVIVVGGGDEVGDGEGTV